MIDYFAELTDFIIVSCCDYTNETYVSLPY